MHPVGACHINPLFANYRPPVLVPFVLHQLPQPLNVPYSQQQIARPFPQPLNVPHNQQEIARPFPLYYGPQITLNYGPHIEADTRNFIRFLEEGCIIAEQIATRNNRRPSFKNIQKLCLRTRMEIIKPNRTVDNIYSQGIPWATKDFIYAYLRLVSCWYTMNGYMVSGNGIPPNIDRMLTAEFRKAYLAWERDTECLVGHMIRIFSNLDITAQVANSIAARTGYRAPTQDVRMQQMHQPEDRATDAARVGTPQQPNVPVLQEVNQNSEEVHNMMPRNYNGSTNGNEITIYSSNNTQFVFLPTAKNVSIHFEKMRQEDEAMRQDEVVSMRDDAQQGQLIHSPLSVHVPTASNSCEEFDEKENYDHLDSPLEQEMAEMGRWVNTNVLEGQNGFDKVESPRASRNCRDNSVPPGEHRKWMNCSVASMMKASTWERDPPGLTTYAIIALDDIVRIFDEKRLHRWTVYAVNKQCYSIRS